MFSCLTAVSVLGTITLFGIRPAPGDGNIPNPGEEHAEESKWTRAKKAAKEAFFEAVKLIQTRDVLLQIAIWIRLQIAIQNHFKIILPAWKMNMIIGLSLRKEIGPVLAQMRVTTEWKSRSGAEYSQHASETRSN